MVVGERLLHHEQDFHSAQMTSGERVKRVHERSLKNLECVGAEEKQMRPAGSKRKVRDGAVHGKFLCVYPIP